MEKLAAAMQEDIRANDDMVDAMKMVDSKENGIDGETFQKWLRLTDRRRYSKDVEKFLEKAKGLSFKEFWDLINTDLPHLKRLFSVATNDYAKELLTKVQKGAAAISTSKVTSKVSPGLCKVPAKIGEHLDDALEIGSKSASKIVEHSDEAVEMVVKGTTTIGEHADDVVEVAAQGSKTLAKAAGGVAIGVGVFAIGWEMWELYEKYQNGNQIEECLKTIAEGIRETLPAASA